MKFLAAAITILSSIGVNAYQQCSHEKQDLIQTGTVQFNNDGKNGEQCYTVGLDYNVPSIGVQTAVSTQTLGDYRPQSGLDYSVRASRKDNENALHLSFLSGDNSWSKVTTSYLATSRPDIKAGSFIADTFSSFGCDSQNPKSDVIRHAIPYFSGKDYKISTFISGVRTRDRRTKIDLSEPVFDSDKGVIEVKVTSNSIPSLENLHIDYILWNSAKFSFATFDPTTLTGDYQFYGPKSFATSQQKTEALAIFSDRLQCQGTACTSGCLETEECKTLGGSVFDNRVCVLCGPYQKIENKQCVPDCKDNQVFRDGVCHCKPGFTKLIDRCVWSCGVNQIWNKGCVCDAGYARLAGVCRKCPVYSTLKDGKCVCDSGYAWNEKNLSCDIQCGKNEISLDNKSCVCAQSFARLKGECRKCPEYSTFKGGKCLCDTRYSWNDSALTCDIECGTNETSYDNKNCVCKDGFARIKGQCRTCPSYSTLKDGKCLCKPSYLWNDQAVSCDLQCGDNETTNDNANCICKQGYVRFKGECRKCPEHALLKDGKCVCQVDYEWQDEGFLCAPLIPTCPPNAKWNQKKLRCECQRNNEYLIGGFCKPCGPNEGWNGKQCVCASDYYKVNGVCRTCDPHTSYNGRDCICNHGYYGNADKCEKCHSSCGQCDGPGAGQCKTCSDVSFDFKDGYCTRNSPCPTGLYLDHQTCRPCSSYCDTCESESVCTTCIEGFKKQTISFYGTEASFCSEKCGDGKRFEVECDDGNNRDGDGCNANCEVEKGWHCQGGSSIKPSTCVSFKPDRSYVSTSGTVHLFGRIVQGVRLSYIPPELTENECALCSKLLWVRVIDSRVVPGVRINYLPKSKYQFLAEFEFNGLFAIPVFSVSIQINPDYAKYFSPSDMAQIEIKKIDPAVLARGNQVETLSLNDIDQIPIAQEDIQRIFE